MYVNSGFFDLTDQTDAVMRRIKNISPMMETSAVQERMGLLILRALIMRTIKRLKCI